MGKQLVNKIRGKNLQANEGSALGLLGYFSKLRGDDVMAKISTQRSSGVKAWAKLSLVLFFAILSSVFMGGGLCNPLQAEAVTYYLQGDTTTNLGFDGTANLPTAQSTGTTIPYRGAIVTAPASATDRKSTRLNSSHRL